MVIFSASSCSMPLYLASSAFFASTAFSLLMQVAVRRMRRPFLSMPTDTLTTQRSRLASW